MQAIISGPHGVFQPEDKFAYAIADEGATAGDILQFDHGNVVATSKNPGSTAYSLYHARVIDADAGAKRSELAYWKCIALQTVASGARCKVQLQGQVAEANVVGTVTAGDCLVATAGSRQLGLATGTSTKRIDAIALEADVSNIGAILFDGIRGFGHDA